MTLLGTLTNLSKMYFSTSDETSVTGISTLDTTDDNEIVAIYDLKGNKISREQMRRGVYIIKTKKGTSKVTTNLPTG